MPAHSQQELLVNSIWVAGGGGDSAGCAADDSWEIRGIRRLSLDKKPHTQSSQSATKSKDCNRDLALCYSGDAWSPSTAENDWKHKGLHFCPTTAHVPNAENAPKKGAIRATFPSQKETVYRVPANRVETAEGLKESVYEMRSVGEPPELQNAESIERSAKGRRMHSPLPPQPKLYLHLIVIFCILSTVMSACNEVVSGVDRSKCKAASKSISI